MENRNFTKLCFFAYLGLFSSFVVGMEIKEGVGKPQEEVKVIPSIQRDQFFKDVTGIEEREFRSKWKDSFRKEARGSRAAAIFQGEFNFYTVADLNKEIGGTIKPLTDKPSFVIKMFDSSSPQESDIGYMQADPNNKHAVFQIASTFWGPLEGGIYKEEAFLSDMLKAPVQGEGASMSAAPATIYRKYFMQSRYLLEYLREKSPFFIGSYGPVIDIEAAIRYKYDQKDIERVGIGVHHDVVVTGGGSAGGGKQERLEVFLDANGDVDTTKSQIVTQVFTSAYNMMNVLWKKGETRKPRDFAQMLLHASYEATLKAAYLKGRPKVVLTLMGGGAFRNDIAWIGNALTNPTITNFIKQAGLQVEVLYRVDKKRRDAVRTVQGDIDFLQRLVESVDAINGTSLKNDPQVMNLINTYVKEGYTYKDSPAYKKATVELNQLFSTGPSVQHLTLAKVAP